MRIDTQDYNDVTVIELHGDLEQDFCELFANTITEVVSRGRGRIVLDMSGVGFIDSQGLERLFWAKNHCSENVSELRLAGLDENCAKILEITKLENEFDRFAELAEAVKSFA